jgi:hypothetical protein
MRIFLSTILLTAFLAAEAQPPPLTPASTDPTQKWQVRPYVSVQAGYAFFHGGLSYLSVPTGVALIHPLNNNFSAFAGVSTVPVAFSMSRLYAAPAVNGSNSGNFSRPYGFGLNAAVQAGLIYTNDAKTFSISGSVGLERGSYPVYPSYRGKQNTSNCVCKKHQPKYNETSDLPSRQFRKDKTFISTSDKSTEISRGTWAYDANKKLIRLTVNGNSNMSIVSLKADELSMVVDTKSATPDAPSPLTLVCKIKGK